MIFCNYWALLGVAFVWCIIGYLSIKGILFLLESLGCEDDGSCPILCFVVLAPLSLIGFIIFLIIFPVIKISDLLDDIKSIKRKLKIE